MKTVKVNELSGAALDWAVATCEGKTYKDALLDGYIQEGWCVSLYPEAPNYWIHLSDYTPSTDWKWGGPIIAREKINLMFCIDLRDRDGRYTHADMDTRRVHGYAKGHDNPLLSAMRCYVASKMGHEIEVPEELA